MKIKLTETQMDEVIVKCLKSQLRQSKIMKSSEKMDEDREYHAKLAKAIKTVLSYYEP